MATRTDYQAILDQYVKDNSSNPLTLSSKRVINKLLRKVDDSHLYPILGKFNATTRAINRYNRLSRYYGMELADCTYSYVESINSMISQIVNDPDNWRKGK